MYRQSYRKLVEMSMQPDHQEQTIEYLAEHLGKFLKPRERVVLAFREHKEGSISWLMEQAALRIDAVPVIWGPDHRWNTLLRQTFFSYASAVIGPPMIILGLMKLKKKHNTPLPIRKVVTTGYPCPQWMIDGIVEGLDCEVGGCFNLMESGIVAGFACGRSWGVHLRQEIYGIDVVDEWGNSVPSGQLGQMVLYPQADPSVRFPFGDLGRVETEECPCGSKTLRLLDMQQGVNMDRELYDLTQQLLQWTSILDCRAYRGHYGLELEIVCFPGEKLPKFPAAGKLLIRPWNPKNDEPFWFFPGTEASELQDGEF